ncbi:Uncharacterized conserved protein, DUF2147 family [Marivirga sericea]|uniref:Uncharacterized conserved protein, DUF2147 family n=1 Tax=Marivirga sericea TaxID=1028 RepID=A0A1X7IQ45_9BACT|nr:DUF2147 domain-containing protein [Marivirga sericea]SMG17194.1 Uncharacterized conserved protein, DUF2147 family [Marivirga sericea]
MKQISLALLLIGISFSSLAQSDVTGKWKTIDDETGKEKSIVEIFEKDGMIYGKITKLFRGPDEEKDPICNECTGDRKNEKIIGMEIIRGMEWDADDEEYEEGTIMDPQDGKVYDCVLWKEGEELKVRGYVAFFYRTQTWEKVN